MQFALPTRAFAGRRPARSATIVRRRTTRRNTRSWSGAVFISVLAVTSASFVVASVAGMIPPLPLLDRLMLLPNAASAEPRSVDDGPAPLTVRTEPPGAQVVLDGRVRGRTPLDLRTSVGQHAVFLDANDSISTVEQIDVPVTGSVADVALWTRRPTGKHLRPPYPGAQLTDAAFLSDGRLQLVVALPDRQGGQLARSLHEAWVVEPASRPEPGTTASIVGPRAAAVAVSPDGHRVATLQDAARLRPGGTSAQSAPSRQDSLWIASAAARADLGTTVFRLDPPTQTLLGPLAREELVDIAWQPDSRHVLIASRLGDPVVSGPVRTRLLLVDAGAEGDERIDAQPTELIVLPAEVLLETAVWSPDARHVAVLLGAAAAPGGRRLIGLGVIDVDSQGGDAFRYVADLGPDDGPAGRLPVAPVAWEPCAPDRACGVEQRLVYSAPVPNAGQPSAGPLGLLGLSRAPSTTPGGLFVSTVSSAALAVGDAPRLGSATGVIGLAWRSVGSGVDGAPLVGMGRGGSNALGLRAIDVVSGAVKDLGAQLAPEVGAGAGSIGIRWDVPHARALVLARSSGHGSASSAEGMDVWLVDFGPAQGEGR